MSSQVKLNKNTLIGLIIGVVIVVVAIILLRPSEHDKITKAYDKLDNNHILDEVSYSEFEKLGSKESGVYLVLISRPTCLACQTQINDIDRAVQSRIEDGTIDVDVLYYLNTDKMSDSQKNALIANYGVQGGTPDLLIMEDNEVVKSSLDWHDEAGSDGEWLYTDEKIDYYKTYRKFIKLFAV